MANLNSLDFLQSPPSFKITAIPNLMPTLLWILIIGTFLFIVYKFMTNRIYIEMFEFVHDGFISKGGRYKYARDKKTSLEGLRPMFGSEVLPMFSHKYFQKTSAMPFIGVKRELRLLRVNKYNYKPFLPTPDQSNKGKAEYVSTLVWEFHKQEVEYLKKLKRAEILQFIQMFAAVMVILGMMFIVAMAVYFEVGRTEAIANGLKEVVRIVEAANGR